MSKNLEYLNYNNLVSEESMINDEDNNIEFICPTENIIYNISQTINANNSETPKKKKHPNFPIENIYSPELFLDQEDLDKFTCGLCENICIEPVHLCCGCKTIYCRKCLFYYLEHFNQQCPECKQISNKTVSIDGLEVFIKKMKMKCKNYVANCTWQGLLKEYEEHITKKCPKDIINCPYKGCVIKLKREEMKDHMEKCEYMEIICEKCKLKIYKNHQESHIEKCLKEKINCPQGCEEIIERGDFNLHKQTCIYSIINCPYDFAGCADQFKRSEIKQRLTEDMEKHLNLVKEKFANLEKNIKELKDENLNLKNEIKELKKDKLIKKKEIKEVINISELNVLEKSVNKKNSSEKKDKPVENVICLLESENLERSGKKKNIENNKEKDIKTPPKKENEIINLVDEKKNYLSNKRKPSHNIEINNNNSNNKNNNSDNNDNSNKNSVIFNTSKEQFEVVNKDNKDFNSENINGQPTDIYELLEQTKDLFIINNNTIEGNSLKGKKQYYVFFKKKYDIPKTNSKKYMIIFNLVKSSSWLGIGVCDKKIVAKNNYQYSPPKKSDGKTPNIGTYVISTNKMAWNCNNVSQCKQFEYGVFKDNTIVKCIISPTECELDFMIDNKVIVKFNDVRCFKSDCFSPCIVFLHNSIVETNFNYP